MKKYALDTNALIAICESDEMTKTLFGRLTNHKMKAVVNKRTLEEFSKRPDSTQLANYSKLSPCLVNDDQQFFTLDESNLDGGDPLPSHTYESMVKDYSEEAYKAYEERAKAPLSRAEWVRRLQGDPTIYAWAELTGCDYFVTDDDKLRRKIPANLGPRAISVDSFIKAFEENS
ncbi:MAG: hypothetical protein WD603_01850 [Patescibacteria group bacterium]